MTALEIVITIILCIIGACIVLLWGQTTLLIYKIVNRQEKEKKPASKTEADSKK